MSDKEQDNEIPRTKVPVENDTEQELRNILNAGLAEKTKAQGAEPAQGTDNAEPERKEMPRDQTFDSVSPTVDPDVFDNTANKKLLEEVEVTDFEKETFFENLVQDTAFALEIEVFPGKTIRIGSRNVYEQALCYACVGDLLREAEASEADEHVDILLWLQRFSCTLAVQSIFGEDQEYLTFEGTSENINPEHKRKLREVTLERYGNMAFPRWQTILTAFMIFTAKEKILLENVGNKDFWNPVG